MPELIEKGSAIQKLCAECVRTGSFICKSCIIPSIIQSIPTIDAEPVRNGQWEYDDVNDLDYCSECNTGMNGKFPFCPWCGAKMDGGAENG